MIGDPQKISRGLCACSSRQSAFGVTPSTRFTDMRAQYRLWSGHIFVYLGEVFIGAAVGTDNAIVTLSWKFSQIKQSASAAEP